MKVRRAGKQLKIFKKKSLKNAMKLKPQKDEESSGEEMEDEVEMEEPAPEVQPKKKSKRMTKQKETTEIKDVVRTRKTSKDSESGEEDDDMSDEEVLPTSSHKKDLSKLKDVDPELFQFLQEEDADLLEYEDEDEEEEEEDEEPKDESDEEGEDDERRKDAYPKVKTVAGGRRKIFDERMYEYLEEQLEKDKISGGACRLGVNAFMACVARVGAEMEPPAWIIDEQEVFDDVVRLCFKRLGEGLFDLLGKPEDDESDEQPISGRLSFPRWKKYSPLVKTFLQSILLFLNEIQTPNVIISTVKTVAGLATMYAQFPKLARHLIKALVRIWTRKTLECRCAAYFAMNAILRASPDLFALMYKSCYMGFVSCARDVSSESWPLLLFMHRSFAQLSITNAPIAYQYAFVYIRQTAIHIRNAVISNKRKDLVQSVYNWQLMQCLYMWTRVISLSPTVADTEALIEMTYPLASIIMATYKLFPSQRYLPLRIHCVQLLLQLQTSCDKFIPTLSLCVDMLAEAVNIMRTKPREANMKVQAPDLSSTLKSLNQELESAVWRKAVVEELFKLTLQSAHALSTHPAFPDVVLPLSYRLRTLIKSCRSPEMSTQMKNLVDKLNEHSVWVRKQMAVREIDITDEIKMIGLRLALKDPKSPLAAFYQKWTRYWKQREALMKTSDSREVDKKQKKEKTGKKSELVESKRRKVVEEDDDESDEEIVIEAPKKLSKGQKKKMKKTVRASEGMEDTIADLGDWSD